VGLTQPVVEVSRPHIIRHTTHTHTVGLLGMRDQPVAEAVTHTTDTKNIIHALSGIRTLDPSNRAVADLSFRPQGHREMRYDVKPKIRWKNKASRTHAVSKGRSSEHSSAVI